MKVFIALALVSVALATPVIQPVQLPAAPQPAMEAMPYMPQPVDIRPAFVPVEVLEALRLQEIPAEILAEVAHVDTAFEALKVANLGVAFLVEEIPAEPVKIVEVAENIQLAPSAEAVKVVDFPEIVKEDVAAPVDAVKVVEVAPEQLAVLADEEIPAGAVNIVEIAENIEAEVAAEEIPADAVKFVEVAENNVQSVAQDAVRVIDAPVRYPGKVYDNPMLR